MTLYRLFFVACLLLLPVISSAEVPEALLNEYGIPDSLAESESSGENLGFVTEDELLERFHTPLQLFPLIRQEYTATGIPFFDGMEFEIAPRFYYRMVDNGDGTRSQAAAYGGSIGMKSGWLYDFLRIGLTGFMSQKLYAPDSRPGTGLLAPIQRSYTVLGEAFVDLKLWKAVVRTGRQRISLPYINGNDSRMTPNTFEGIGLKVTEWNSLTFGAAHLTGIKPRTNSTFVPMSEAAGAPGTDEGVTLGGLHYSLGKESYVSAINEYGWDTFNTFFMSGQYYWDLNEHTSFQVGAQFTDQRSVGQALIGDFKAQLFGLTASVGYHALIASLSFSWNPTKDPFQKPWGGTPSYNSVLISDFDGPEQKAIRVGLTYDFTDLGAKGISASTTYVYGDTTSGLNAPPDQQEFDINVDYKPEIEGFNSVWFRIRYGMLDFAGLPDSSTVHDFRIILNYSIDF